VGNDGKCTPRSFRGTPPLFYRSIFTIRACLKPSSSSLCGVSRRGRRRVYYEKHKIIIIRDDDDTISLFRLKNGRAAKNPINKININLVHRHVRATIIIYYYRIKATTLHIIMANGLLRLQTAISVP